MGGDGDSSFDEDEDEDDPTLDEEDEDAEDAALRFIHPIANVSPCLRKVEGARSIYRITLEIDRCPPNPISCGADMPRSPPIDNDVRRIQCPVYNSGLSKPNILAKYLPVKMKIKNKLIYGYNKIPHTDKTYRIRLIHYAQHWHW